MEEDKKDDDFSLYNYLKKKNEKLILDLHNSTDERERKFIQARIKSNVALMLKIVNER